ncbi:DNA ligase D [Xanthomonas sp. XNM01]|uniref:DNA ligase D n=1 Tax=Xanthomonas sp. XNM01 TaxID=2769289 RepID=UPI00177E4DF1|nr:DNA ligase D [Xanthomonas sp. XNM01]MBD9370771.1 DNA ligase D [Xanthomonas sp. XNM01]
MSLRDYQRKRRFDAGGTPEPQADAPGGPSRRPIFVVQLHHASSRHYDFRLEADGALKSWAVPKGPSLRPGEKRLAVQVEDHPLSYAGFEGDIPEGHYGAGHVDVFDHGTWACDGDPLEAIAAGKLDFVLHGGKLEGGWKLVRTAPRGRQPQWLLIKRDDAGAADLEADDLVDSAPRRSAPTRGRAGKASGANRTGAGRSTQKPAPAARRRRRADATWHRRALALPGARDRPHPTGFAAQLATARSGAPSGEDWLHEIKWDGYRLLADLVDGVATLRSRGGLTWTGDFPEVARAIEALPVGDARLDGELVVLDADGRSDFSALQRVIDGTSKAPLRYVVFDLPGLAGVDLAGTPLQQRKALLRQVLGEEPGILAYSDHVLGHGPEVFAATGDKGFEGIVSKRVDARYVSARSHDWVKVKHENTDEFVVVGYTDPKGARSGFGSLLMARPGKSGGWQYVGRVGTGFDDAMLARLLPLLEARARGDGVVALPAHVPFSLRSVHWVEPELVAEVAFRGWGKEGLLRQAAFKRLRADKPLEDVQPAPALSARSTSAGERRTAAKRSSAAPAPSARGTDDAGDTVTISSPDRVVYPSTGMTKAQVADYYRAIAPWLLPEVARRPLSLLRCPDGVAGDCFFQKHESRALGTHVHAVPLRQKSGMEDYLYIEDAAGLLELVQMNTLELHPWGAGVDDPEHPDRLVFDLDPGEGVGWNQIRAAARDIRAKLQQAGLESFVRLSGGKGLHVVVPIAPEADWEQARDFSEAFAQALAAQAPDRYVATMSKAKRRGVIFVDWLRNGRGNTSVCSWSLRARDTPAVAVPLRWDELGRIASPQAFSPDKALARARRLKADPWAGFATLAQRLPGIG